jgi:Holliday junction resolvase RusA-like endonuclease
MNNNNIITLVFSMIPQAKQSDRNTKDGRHYQTKKVKNYNDTLKSLIIQSLPTGFKIINQPVKLVIEFCYPPPKSLSKTNSRMLQNGDIEIYKTTRPDIDNLQKQLYDAMNGTVIIDDSQIVEVHIKKRITLQPATILDIIPTTVIIPKQNLGLIN